MNPVLVKAIFEILQGTTYIYENWRSGEFYDSRDQLIAEIEFEYDFSRLRLEDGQMIEIDTTYGFELPLEELSVITGTPLSWQDGKRYADED